MKKITRGHPSSVPCAAAHNHPRQLRALAAVLVLLCCAAGAVFVPRARDAVRLREAYLPELEKLVLKNPHDGRLLSLVGARLAEAGDYKAASQSYLSAIGAGDNDPLVWLAWAEAESAFGDDKRAGSVLRMAIQQKTPGLSQAVNRLRDAETAAPGALKATTLLLQSCASGSFLNRLFEWWGRRHPESSGFSTRQRWAAEEPDNGMVQRLWGEALTTNRDFRRAETVLRRALILSPRSPEAHQAMADLLTKTGRDEEAKLENQKAAELRAGDHSQPASLPTPTSGDARFADVTRQAGIHCRWSIPGKPPYNILQTIGNGCAFLDYNRDGNLDILLIGPHLALYKGDGKGHFSDVTHETGLDKLSGVFLGCAVGDFDNDGWDDLYISAYRGGVLLHNEGGKRFQDVTRASGIGPQPWGTSCAFADVDSDGMLDLFIANYIKFDAGTDRALCRYGKTLGACSPDTYGPERGVLYHNEGHGHFRDVTQELGLGSASGKALGVAFADYDGSGHQSLAIGNDEMPGDLFRNSGGHFNNEGTASGTAFDSVGDRHAGMGVDWGDYDNDGKLDLAVTTFQHQSKSIYHNDGGSAFTERSSRLGVNVTANQYLNFGVKWLDYDNDGWLDLALANGHVVDSIAQIDPGVTFKQRPQLFHNLGGQSFEEVTDRAGDPFQRKILGRGLAVGDFDNDGREDLLMVDSDGEPMLLHNETPQTGHWLSFRLIGNRSNRDAVGAMVTVESGKLKLIRRCGSDGSYLSASDGRVHFGIGSEQSASTVTIHWPSGSLSAFHNVTADHFYAAREGAASLEQQ